MLVASAAQGVHSRRGCGALSLSYLAYLQSYPIVPLGIHLLEFLPLYVLLLAQGRRQRGPSPLREPTTVIRMEQPT
jgi:hypothetical protein